MTVKSVDRDVCPGTREPLVMYAVPFQNAVPLPRPGELAGVICPENFGILRSASAFSLPVLLEGVAAYDFRRRIFLIEG